MARPLVEVNSVSKVYEPYPLWLRALARSATPSSVTALDDVTFDVAAGQMCVIIGPNGAGKSTLFRILTGLTTPTGGASQIDGRDVTRQSANVRRIVGFMPADDRTLFLRNTCAENLEFHGRLQGIPRKQLAGRIEQVLELVGLADARDRSGHALSSGMKARLQLARALLHEPKVLILDEPTGAVDPIGAFDLLQQIVAITHERGLATLISSHRLEEIEALKDYVILLDGGRVVFSGDLDEVRAIWEVPRFTLTLHDTQVAQRVASRLASSYGGSNVDLDRLEVSVASSVDAGAVMSMLDDDLSALVSFRSDKISLRELLDATLSSHMERGSL